MSAQLAPLSRAAMLAADPNVSPAFKAALAPAAAPSAEAERRARLLRFIDHVGADRRQYVLCLGNSRLPHDALTDETLEQLAERVCLDFWFERTINRQNRATRARRAS